MDRLAAMETFVYVVETGSFSAAARRLNIGQPAVSKTIAQLEARLAVRLLLRSTRGLTPTEAGLVFFRVKRCWPASQWMFAPELSSGTVREVMKEWSLPNQDLWAVFPTGRMASAKARAFVEYVRGLLVREI
ncbi:LysR family transcriptional regulator [Pseudomonas sp. LB3P81]